MPIHESWLVQASSATVALDASLLVDPFGQQRKVNIGIRRI